MYPNDFWHKRKIATNIPQRLKTCFVVQGHIQVHLNKLECRGKVHLFQ